MASCGMVRPDLASYVMAWLKEYEPKGFIYSRTTPFAEDAVPRKTMVYGAIIAPRKEKNNG